jgi:hypothetical protein
LSFEVFQTGYYPKKPWNCSWQVRLLTKLGSYKNTSSFASNPDFNHHQFKIHLVSALQSSMLVIVSPWWEYRQQHGKELSLAAPKQNHSSL